MGCTYWCANSDCRVDGLIEGDKGLCGGGVEGGDHCGTGKQVGIREMRPCCYC